MGSVVSVTSLILCPLLMLASLAPEMGLSARAAGVGAYTRIHGVNLWTAGAGGGLGAAARHVALHGNFEASFGASSGGLPVRYLRTFFSIEAITPSEFSPTSLSSTSRRRTFRAGGQVGFGLLSIDRATVSSTMSTITLEVAPYVSADLFRGHHATFFAEARLGVALFDVDEGADGSPAGDPVFFRPQLAIGLRL